MCACSLWFKFCTPFELRYHGDESQDAKMCKLQEVWATSKEPPCEILLAVFRSQLKIEGQRVKWELKPEQAWQSRERGEREDG